jgi:4-hydroxy-tetrahydrodipicolinate synthase
VKLEELKKKIKGVVVVNITPFNKDGSVDMGGFRANLQWMLEKVEGKDYIFNPLGSTGEFYAMSDDECKAIMKATAEEVKGKLPVFVGAGRAGTQETVKMCKYAESVGVDGVQVILPYYFAATEEGAYQHYKTIAENIKIAVMVYNYPVPSGSWIKPPLMAKIAKIPNIIACKENTINVTEYILMKKTVDPEDMTIICGKGEQYFSYEALVGCPGLVSTNANLLPDWSYSIYQAALERDFTEVDRLMKTMSPYTSFIDRITSKRPHIGVNGPAPMFIPVTKAAMDMAGLRGGEVRLPITGLTAEEKDELSGILKSLKIID